MKMSDSLHLSDIVPARVDRLYPKKIADVCNQSTVATNTKAAEDQRSLELGGCTVGNTSSDLVAFYLGKSRAYNTKRAYLSDLEDFVSWGGGIPASAECIAAYLADKAADLTVSMLRKRLAALAWVHRGRRYADPTKHQIVVDVMRGIERHHGVRQHQAKPLLYQNLLEICSTLGSTPKDKRDRTLLTFGFFSAMRGTELVSTRIEDLTFQDNCIEVLIRRSKTDQTSQGRTIAIPIIGGVACPFTALRVWLSSNQKASGYLFSAYRTAAGGNAHLSVRQVSRIMATRAKQCGLANDGYSSHGLRAGFITSAHDLGLDLIWATKQSGHRSLRTAQRYARPDPTDVTCRIVQRLARDQ